MHSSLRGSENLLTNKSVAYFKLMSPIYLAVIYEYCH